MTVPAHFWLWSREDRVAAHKRRYNLKGIKRLFENNGFEVIRARNFFTTIIPLLFLRKIINHDSDKNLEKDEILNYDIKKNPMVNFFLDKLLSLELKLTKNLNPSIGGSIILIARRRDD